MIERQKDFPSNVLAFVCKGPVTKQDYDTVLVPAVDEALKRDDKLRIYYETGDDFSVEPGAMWADFKVGMEHLTRWERMAVVTDIDWIKNTMQFFSFMMPGEMKTFPRAEAAQARAWITAK